MPNLATLGLVYVGHKSINKGEWLSWNLQIIIMVIHYEAVITTDDLGGRHFTCRCQELSIIIIPIFQIKKLALKDIIYSLILQRWNHSNHII